MYKSDIKKVPEYYHRYINLVDDFDFLTVLKIGLSELENLQIGSLENIGNKVYETGKWTVKDIFQHLIDTERVFTYRALAFARKDKETIPPFDENDYAVQARRTDRNLKDLISEYIVVRKGLIALFEPFSNEVLSTVGQTLAGEISVIAYPFILAGHQRWHFKILKEKYLPLSS